MKLRELRQIIREEISKARLSEAPLDFDLADKIASGTYQRPESSMDSNTTKKIEIINKFTSRPFGYKDTIDLFNNLGPINPKELKSIKNKLNNVDFEMENYEPGLVNLVIYSKNYKDKGVALTWDDNEWSQ